MKKILFIVCTIILFINSSCYAGTATEFNNINATILRDKIIKLYAIEGAHVENFVTNTNSFSISKNKMYSTCNIRTKYDYTIVQDGNNSIVSLTMSMGIGAYPNSAMLTSEEQKELDRVKNCLFGYYSYGLGYPQKIYFYTEYNEDGILVQKNIMAASQRILGIKLTSVKLDAKNQGLNIGDRIKNINGKKISKYSKIELVEVLKPLNSSDEIEITYKRHGKFNNVKLKSTFVKPDARL